MTETEQNRVFMFSDQQGVSLDGKGEARLTRDPVAGAHEQMWRGVDRRSTEEECEKLSVDHFLFASFLRVNDSVVCMW